MVLPDEYWEAHVYVMLGLECHGCGARLDCEHCWDDVLPDEGGAQEFSHRAVTLAKDDGWSLEYDPEKPKFFCPPCTAKRKIA